MTWAHACFAVLGVGLGAAFGCGGKVFVDLPGDGNGGSGGSGGSGGGSASGVPATSTSSGGLDCTGDGECLQGSDGSCSCSGVCDGQKLQVDCKASPGGINCNCIENGIIIGKCQDSFDVACEIEAGCCAAFFPGGAQ